MKTSGIVQNGVIVLEGGVLLPEGTLVDVTIPSPLIKVKAITKRAEFPLVPSANPGSVRLTNEMIGEILDDEDGARIAILKPHTQSESPDTAPNIPNPK